VNGRDAQAVLPARLNGVLIALLLVFAMVPILFMVLMSVTPDSDIAGARATEPFRVRQLRADVGHRVAGQRAGEQCDRGAGVGGGGDRVRVGAAYCLTRFTFVGRRPYLAVLVFLQSVPQVLLLLPLFMVFSSAATYLGLPLVGTRLALILAYLTFALPLATWVMVTYFRKIPRSLEEAGLIDGLTRFGTLWRIVVPLSWPGMVVAPGFRIPGGLERRGDRQRVDPPGYADRGCRSAGLRASIEGGTIPQIRPVDGGFGALFDSGRRAVPGFPALSGQRARRWFRKGLAEAEGPFRVDVVRFC